jgi:hypothetical protein
MEYAEPTPTFLLDTNIMLTQNSKMPPAGSFTFNPIQLYSTSLGGLKKNKQLTIIKPTKTGINRKK